MENVDHFGVVQEIIGDRIKVSILAKSACSSCSIKSVCNPAETQEKTFTVKSENVSDFTVGEHVKLVVSSGKGLLAVVLSYVIPVIIIFTGLIIGLSIGYSEGVAALIAMGATAFYFFILFLTRQKAEKSFGFTIHKI